MFKVSLLKQKSRPSTRQLKIVSILKSVFYSTLGLLLSIPSYVLYSLLFCSLIILQYYYFHLAPDISIQLNTLVNFVHGHGIALSTLNQNNQVVFHLTSHWPAGLVVFLSPLFLVTNNTIASAIMLNAICYLFYILFLIRYLKYLQVSPVKKKFIILFIAVSVAPFIHFFPSDTLATVICLWGFYYNLKYQDSKKIKFLIGAVFVLASAYFIKYSFLPFVFYPFASFFVKERSGAFKKIKEGTVIFLWCCIAVLFFYSVNEFLVGHNDIEFATSFDLFTGKAHWNQLSHFNGFLFTFGTYEWVIENLFKNHLNLHIQFNWFSVVITVYFYYLFLELYFKKPSIYNSLFFNSINISLSAGGLIIAFLTFLTLNNPGQTWTTPYWTYVQEPRYYGPVIIIGLINIVVIFLNEKKGRLIHIIVPVIVLFNLYAYRTIIQGGFWGRNYAKYLVDKNNIYKKVPVEKRQASGILLYS